MQQVNIDAPQVRAALLSRGVSLNPPASPDTLDKLVRWSGNPLHADLLAVLNEFDGFANHDFDADSFVHVRPISAALSDEWTEHPTLAFADWSLNAFVFGVDPSTGAAVLSIENGQLVAPSYADFWSLLLSNKLL